MAPLVGLRQAASVKQSKGIVLAFVSLALRALDTRQPPFRVLQSKKQNKKDYFEVVFFILAPLVGLEPTTYRLTAERSTN